MPSVRQCPSEKRPCCCAAAECVPWPQPSAPPSWAWRPTTSWKALKATWTARPSGGTKAGGACVAFLGDKAEHGMTFLALDIGNTRLKWALYAGPRAGAALLAE